MLEMLSYARVLNDRDLGVNLCRMKQCKYFNNVCAKRQNNNTDFFDVKSLKVPGREAFQLVMYSVFKYQVRVLLV